MDIRGLFWKLRQAARGPPPTTGLSMSNNVATAMGDHQSHPRLAQQAEEADCSTCSAITEDSAAQDETGALLRLCPVCGRAWPLFTTGERGAMAQSTCARVNRRLQAGSPRHSG